LADLAFIGKSLPPNEGGQTPIEAAAYGVPIVYGPAMTNFKAACRSLEECGAALRKETPREIDETLVDLAMDPERRKAMGERGVAWHQANRGAVRRTVSTITHCLPPTRNRP
jgi:3-deoxy-D-manno-octulosonic-acid transferase